jgi:dGTPase
MTSTPRQIKEARELEQLAPYATLSSQSMGRVFPEEGDPVRTCFERDRDRIVHSAAFRRLMYKTQVFLNEEGDEHRTRLSHSLEVAQVARTLASALNLNEHLVEALALSHDIGHPAFGHRGEVALHALMEDHGGFRHNNQVLRVVDLLERRSPDYSGLNLTREVRESLLKHESASDWPAEFEPRPRQPRLEAQVTDLADSTAYNKHDIEDGLTAGMFTEEQIYDEVALWRRSVHAVEQRHPGFLASSKDPKLRVQRIANQLIGAAIGDLLESSSQRLAEAAPGSMAEVQAQRSMLIGHSDSFSADVAELSRFLHKRFYRHEHLQRFLVFAHQVLGGLFEAYRTDPGQMPEWYREWAVEQGLERAICDFLAGMTDRFALREHERLVGPLPSGFEPLKGRNPRARSERG